MNKIKVMTVFGTRPEAIKMAPLVKELENRSDDFDSVVCVTAQHRQMLDQVLEIFDITPDYDLDIMRTGQTLKDITCRCIEGVDDVINSAKPDIILVHGDTSTTFAGALAAFYNKIEVGHVEAGLRTYDRYSPYPEEMNRLLTSRLASLHFAPTIQNFKNLLKENITEGIFITGNTVIDALKTTVAQTYTFKCNELNQVDFSIPTILLTAHRRENLGEPMENIMNAVKHIVETHNNIQVVYPVHLNPAVRNTVFKILGDCERVHLIDPVDVEDMHNLMDRCYFVMTDSGGLQEEAPSLGKPVLVLRCETERPEAVEYGTVKIAGVEKDNIIKLADELLENKEVYNKMAHSANPYGDGEASRRICDALLYHFGKKDTKPDQFRI
jgi:UDP-N-acetylglucosamine 2-epimerase (non-hydrolysing)